MCAVLCPLWCHPSQPLTVHELQDERHVVAEGVFVELDLEVGLEDQYFLAQKLEHHRWVDVGARYRDEIQIQVPLVKEGGTVQLWMLCRWTEGERGGGLAECVGKQEDPSVN